MKTMSPRLRKFALSVHIAFSVGWFGAVAGFLALAVAGLTSQDADVVRGAYLSMALTAGYVLVPLSVASLLTGLVMSLGTPWGLFRHYWTLLSLVLTIVAVLGLLVHLQPISYMASVASQTRLSSADFLGQRIQLVAAAVLGLVVLFVTQVLNVYKPAGMTRYGWRKQHEQRTEAQT